MCQNKYSGSPINIELENNIFISKYLNTVMKDLTQVTYFRIYECGNQTEIWKCDTCVTPQIKKTHTEYRIM